MSLPINDTINVRIAITEAVRNLSPPSSLLVLFFIANQQRIASLQVRLAAIDAEIEERRVMRNAAARRLALLGGRPKPRSESSDNTVAFPVFQKTGTP
jgi:hypothetical protein